jgi:hypothetical protein
MSHLLCQVCAGPADRTEDGVLWLLPDHRDDWASWPKGMAAVEPPVCLPCVRTAARLCPALRKGAAAVRVRRYPVVGVRGALWKRVRGTLEAVEHVIVPFTNPAIQWVQAGGLVRELNGCTIVPLDKITNEPAEH